MAERPVECSQCKKAAKVIYKEIVGKTVTVTEMCADCPILLEKIHGSKGTEGEVAETTTGLFCGRCHTALESVKMGGAMGCSDCYKIFGDLLIGELIAEEKLPKHFEQARRNQPLHVGNGPGEVQEAPSSNRLVALNEALNEALKKENYEEAAWLRDQIKEITDNE